MICMPRTLSRAKMYSIYTISYPGIAQFPSPASKHEMLEWHMSSILDLAHQPCCRQCRIVPPISESGQCATVKHAVPSCRAPERLSSGVCMLGFAMTVVFEECSLSAAMCLPAGISSGSTTLPIAISHVHSAAPCNSCRGHRDAAEQCMTLSCSPEHHSTAANRFSG